jgi:hypothetical protein
VRFHSGGIVGVDTGRVPASLGWHAAADALADQAAGDVRVSITVVINSAAASETDDPRARQVRVAVAEVLKANGPGLRLGGEKTE